MENDFNEISITERILHMKKIGMGIVLKKSNHEFYFYKWSKKYANLFGLIPFSEIF